MWTLFIPTLGSSTTKPCICKTSCGFTLIEILISLAISGIILTGILYVFETSNKSYIVQDDVARMQQNVRIAKYYIEKDLRMAGYGVMGMASDDGFVEPVVFENDINETGILSGTDSITITYIDDDRSGCGTGGTYSACDDLPQLLLKEGMPATSSEAKVQEDFGTAPYSAWPNDCSCNGIDYTMPKPGYQVLITSPDGSKSDLVYVTQVQKVGTDDMIQNSPYNGFTNKVLNGYPENSTINFFNINTFIEVRYFIDDQNYLIREENGGDDVKVAENIEDIQVAFCGDYDGDGTVDITDTGDWYDEADLVSGEMSDADKEEIRYARVTIVGRTAREHDGIASKRPAVEDHAGAVQSDYYARRVLSFTVKIRNLGL
ncbi:prepilin-type N-terminal cleavage/methylation domain-containing protein [uncultured Desulfobacter sp.]|uniref:prepilin-type N-terminal cleavage/methylation domain-containing protein n=1 Tax=uncultured Desulfobacter sp. TaxID=240139 RepID=UPI0029F56B7C|nr:prepilin-type N-terminal cleavage/methylation domain-containing protein [uncultured Desulfobacter sp.]